MNETDKLVYEVRPITIRPLIYLVSIIIPLRILEFAAVRGYLDSISWFSNVLSFLKGQEYKLISVFLCVVAFLYSVQKGKVILDKEGVELRIFPRFFGSAWTAWKLNWTEISSYYMFHFNRTAIFLLKDKQGKQFRIGERLFLRDTKKLGLEFEETKKRFGQSQIQKSAYEADSQFFLTSLLYLAIVAWLLSATF
ncbi:hypothetical protein EHQ53_17395 [Leptospira langatensis]|uniref:Uncharacterized protein n=1 Tax=Leptospira langatensis TaxID=2484983 RepID=A0A5F1ZP85_9LEPT|nr:hypothetical protein [Leptospira langatensis]TGK05411.1 hypothetical protein EHO57_01635 [Leptospira langatensis]TGL38547.1 hypothetical protein EHQ53_17395 [Leptospira langatensis]